MIRIDLLAAERSSVAKLAMAFLHSQEFRQTILVPAIALAIVFAVYGYERVVLSGLQSQRIAAQSEYRSLVDEESNARLRVQNYEKLKVLYQHLSSVRRSAIDRALEIRAIGNIVFQHGLRLTSISDKAEQGFWDLSGVSEDGQRGESCFSSLAAALPLFVSTVPHIVDAMPANRRDERGSQSCSYTVRLTRGGGR